MYQCRKECGKCLLHKTHPFLIHYTPVLLYVADTFLSEYVAHYRVAEHMSFEVRQCPPPKHAEPTVTSSRLITNN